MPVAELQNHRGKRMQATVCASAAQYNEAIQNLRSSVSDEELRQGQPALNALGLPLLFSGGFADVYKVHCAATGNTWAVKCFTRATPGLRDRYREISAHLDRVKLPFMADFQYVEPGIRAGGQWRPFLKMRWIEGYNLNQFVSDYLDRPKTLKLLLQLWVKLAARLREAEVGHADLQHGNVLLVPAGEKGLSLKLIDYDGMYVPALARTRSGELGHPCYQHPQRLREGIYSLEVDRFSHLAIYCAIQCLIAGRRPLWQRFDSGDNLLFRETDFRSPGASAALREMWAMRDPDARSLAGRLILATQRPLGEVPLLDELVRDGRVRSLSREERQRVDRVLSDGTARGRATPPSLTWQETAPAATWATVPAPAAPESPSGAGERPWWATGPAGDLPSSAVSPATAGVPAPTAAPLSEPGKSSRRGAWWLRQAIRPAAATWRAVDRLLGWIAGEGNTILHNFLRMVAVVGLALLVGLTAKVAPALWGSFMAAVGGKSVPEGTPAGDQETKGQTESSIGASRVAGTPGQPWAWGDNDFGQLGDGTTAMRPTPVSVRDLAGATALAGTFIPEGRVGNHSVALKSDGTVWAWGHNGYGQLGDETTRDRPVPVKVTGIGGATAVSARGYHTMALKSDGTVWAWGHNEYGELGDGSTTHRHAPVQVKDITSATAIATGDWYSMALKSDGTVWSWGRNDAGQLGDGTAITRVTPVQVGGLTGAVAIAAAGGHSLALKSDGTVWAWGDNGDGRLGNGTTERSHTPVQVKGPGGVGSLAEITAIAVGRYHTLALKSDGTVWSWGGNHAGQLGDGTSTNQLRPIQVRGLSGATSIVAGHRHSMALKSDGTVWAWGDNSKGQLAGLYRLFLCR